jgi:hypothetical protein
MAIHRGSNQPKLVPTAVADAATNFNQSQATLNATVSANDYPTDVYLDWSTSPTFTGGYGTVLVGTITGQNQAVSGLATGLNPGTVYYVRCRAFNLIGTGISTNTISFTTWSLKTYLNTTAGSYSVSIPSIPGVAPVIYEMLLYGGGGGANYGGGGGGGYRLAASHTSSATGTQTVSGTVGAGGAAGNGGTGTGTATAGGSTTLTVGSTTWTGGGGTAGMHPGNCGAPNGNGGTAGTGDNYAYGGGTNTYGYYYISGYVQYCCGGYDKLGNCQGFCPDYNQPIYSYDCGYYACGGGGGTDSAGTNAYTQNSASHNGGTGGTGGGAYGLNGGSGGGGYGTQSTGSQGSVVAGGTTCGRGGTSFAAGQAGGVTFKYYGP